MSLAVVLTVEPAAGGRSRVVALLGDETLHVAEFNLASDVSRERFLKRLGEVAPALGGDGLEVLRGRLVAEAAKPRPAAEGSAPPQGRALAFEVVEPAADPVDGETLLDDVCDEFLRRIVMQGEGTARLCALWVAHAWCIRAFHISPRLAITSPEPGCGKTTTLDVLSALVPKPLAVGSCSAAAAFRVISEHAPSLLFDEADNAFEGEGGEELRRVLNQGHRFGQGVARVEKVEDRFEVVVYDVFGPAAIALIGRLPQTLRDRSVNVELRRKLPGESVVETRPDTIKAELSSHRRRLARWAADHIERLRSSSPEVPSGIANRRADNLRPLLAIAEAAGSRWAELAREAAKASEAAIADEGSHGTTLLRDLRTLFAERATDRLTTTAILDALRALEERPWATWNRGKGLDAHGLARLLRPFSIRPGSVRMPDGGTPKGYSADRFGESWARYLGPEGSDDASMVGTPPPASATPPQPNNHAGLRAIENRHTPEVVAEANRPPRPESRPCGGVADEKGGIGHDDEPEPVPPASCYPNGEDSDEREAVAAEACGRDMETQSPRASTPSPGLGAWRPRCIACGDTRRWRLRDAPGPWICPVCTPPSPGLAVTWLEART